MPSNHLILCCLLLLLPSVFPSIRVFSNESVLWITPKYWSFSFSISPSSDYSGLISFRMDWLDLLAVQGTLKNLLEHHSLKASILWCSAFFIIHLSHPYMITGKTMALTRRTFVDKVMSLVLICCLLLLLLGCANVYDCATPWTAACQASLSITNSQSSTQTHVHLVGDAIHPSHPLSSLSLPALNLSQHQGLFQWVSTLHQVAKVLEFQLQHQSFQWTPKTDLL